MTDIADRLLVIAIRGWTNTGDRLLGRKPGSEIPKEAIQALLSVLPGATIWAPDLDLPMFSMRDAESVVRELYGKVDEKLHSAEGFRSVVLLGYSAGSLLARRLFCMAHGANTAGEICNEPASWAHLIDRLVILSGITRGWEYSTASPDHVRFFSPLLQQIARFVGWLHRFDPEAESKTPFIFQLKRGSSFVVSTRIQYVEVQKRIGGGDCDRSPHADRPLRKNGVPTTVFMLGAKDEFISPADCTELGPREEFVYIELEGSNHADALRLASGDDEARERLRRVAAALSLDFDELREKPWSVAPEDIDDYLDPMDLAVADLHARQESLQVRHVVMVVHGIRDDGFWTKRVARDVKTIAREHEINVRAPSPTYGYFSMWDFIKPGGREKATSWFMERYADVRSHFPYAEVSFVGHSNGTYIAARALQLCPAIRFERVVFAGSVVRRSYAWAAIAGRVREVLNYVGNADGVVAFLPAAFEKLRFRWLDVGGAGAFGFLDSQSRASDGSGSCCVQVGGTVLHEVRFVDGGHGAAIEEAFWPEIARFVLFGTPPARIAVQRPRGIRRLFRWAPILTLGGVVLAASLLTLPISIAAAVTSSFTHSGLYALLMALSVFVASVVSWLLGRFLKAW